MLRAMKKKKAQGEGGGRGNKKTSTKIIEVSDTRLSFARAVNKVCPEMVPQIIAGAMSLDEAYA
jgi:hypothetical protein